MERVKRREEELFMIALDFKKAFDSVNRIKLIKCLIRAQGTSKNNRLKGIGRYCSEIVFPFKIVNF